MNKQSMLCCRKTSQYTSLELFGEGTILTIKCINILNFNFNFNRQLGIITDYMVYDF